MMFNIISFFKVNVTWLYVLFVISPHYLIIYTYTQYTPTHRHTHTQSNKLAMEHVINTSPWLNSPGVQCCSSEVFPSDGGHDGVHEVE